MPRTTPAPVAVETVAALGTSSVRVERRPQLGQAEVQDLHRPSLVTKQVLGLQVAVNDPLLVGRGQAVRDLDRVVDGLAGGERLPARRWRSVSPSSSSNTT